ncbi:MAG TPA: hypothetical protein VMX97_10030, partial [Hyphomicrobiaceae bacterium]|nr:hypothetical protein [Hyphomicrobiaceae bacterium]
MWLPHAQKNRRVARLKIASQQRAVGWFRGGRILRNPRPDQIGLGGRMSSVRVAGSPRNAQGAKGFAQITPI